MVEILEPDLINARPFDAISASQLTALKPRPDNRTADDKKRDAKNRRYLADLAEAIQSDDWIKFCRETRDGAFPSIVTYLSQLLAHDMVESASRHAMFAGGRRNQVDVPLVLSTVYGDGPDGSKELFHHREFRVPEPTLGQIPHFYGSRFSKDQSMPLLADQRNRDNPILIQIATAFMQFHNQRYLDKWSYFEALDSQTVEIRTFAYARVASILAWHNILKNDILPAVCRDQDVDLFNEVLSLP